MEQQLSINLSIPKHTAIKLALHLVSLKGDFSVSGDVIAAMLNAMDETGNKTNHLDLGDSFKG